MISTKPENVKLAIDIMKRVPHKLLDMEFFVNNKPCGTVHCMAGWLGGDAEFQKNTGIEMSDWGTPKMLIDGCTEYGKVAIAHALGIDNALSGEICAYTNFGETNRMNMPLYNKPLKRITKTDVINQLKALIKE